MKKSDKVIIKKPGIFSGAEGTITNIRYYATLSSGYELACDEHELVLLSKDSTLKEHKTTPTEHGIAIDAKEAIESYKKVAKVKPVKEVKVKRAYNRKQK